MASRTDLKLHIQMVPRPLWKKNLRALMTSSEWRRLHLTLIERQGLVCLSCGLTVDQAKKLSAHEEWTYLEDAGSMVAWLRRVSLLCWHCHMCEHPGFLNAAIAEGSLSERARVENAAHYRAVNGVSEKIRIAHLKSAIFQWNRRSKHEFWRVDYGPFTHWARASFSHDPLNYRGPLIETCGDDVRMEPNYVEWRSDLGIPQPDMLTIEGIARSFSIDPAEERPGSPEGRFAFDQGRIEQATAAKRRQKAALKRERSKRKVKREIGHGGSTIPSLSRHNYIS